MLLHDHPGDDREDEELAPFAHVRDVDEDNTVVMEVVDDLGDRGPLRPEERRVAVDEVLDVPLDDPDRAAHGVPDLPREAAFPHPERLPASLMGKISGSTSSKNSMISFPPARPRVPR